MLSKLESWAQMQMSRPSPARLRTLLAAAAIAAIATPCAAQASWGEFKPRDAAYTIQMPGEWTIGERKAPTPSGELPMHMASVKMNNRAYMTIYFSVPEEKVAGQSITAMLDGVRNGVISNGKDTLRSEQRVTVGQYPAREIIIDSPGSSVFVARFFFIRNTMVQAIVAGPPGVEKEPDTVRFLASLKPVGP
jgi:hypothetical protein